MERTSMSAKCFKMKTARTKRAKVLFFMVNYANVWRFATLPTVKATTQDHVFTTAFLLGSSSVSKSVFENRYLSTRRLDQYFRPKKNSRSWLLTFTRWNCRKSSVLTWINMCKLTHLVKQGVFCSTSFIHLCLSFKKTFNREGPLLVKLNN